MYPVTFNAVYNAVGSCVYEVDSWAMTRNNRQSSTSGSNWRSQSTGIMDYTLGIHVIVIGRLTISNNNPKYYLFSPTTNGFYLPGTEQNEIIDADIPADAVRVELDEYHELFNKQSEGYVIKPSKKGHPIAIISETDCDWDRETESWVLNNTKQRQSALEQANNLLNQSIKLESGVYQRRMTTEEQAEFIMRQDSLLDFINEVHTEMPETPPFVRTLLN